MRCVVFALTLVETQHDARIDSDPIFAFPYVAFLRQVIKKPPTFLVICAFHELTQRKVLRHFVNRPLGDGLGRSKLVRLVSLNKLQAVLS